MSIEDLLLIPYEVASWQGPDFSTWTLNGLWNNVIFSSLIRSQNTLWYHTPVVGAYPNHLSDPDYAGSDAYDLATAPSVDLSPFPGAADWRLQVRVIWRPSHIAPQHASVDTQPERLSVVADNGTTLVELGTLDQPILNPGGITNSRLLSRITGDGGEPRVGADGDWWYTQLIEPDIDVQEVLLGEAAVDLSLAMQVYPRTTTGYGVGVWRVALEIMRGGVSTPTEVTMPLHLLPSYFDRRHWVPEG